MTGNEDRLPWPPAARDTRFRTEMTVSCTDCGGIAKHAEAGRISTVDGVRIQTMHNGIRVVAGGYGGEWTEEIIARLRGHHEPQEELVFHHILQRLPAKATMVELGGNWSYYSLWFLEGAPGERRAIVVEPDPNNLETGRRNARLNGREIEFLQACVGAESLSGKPFRTETAGIIDLPQVTVPELVERCGIERLDILHCDAQGVELDVVRSVLDLMGQGAIGFVVISTHAHQVCGDPLMHQRCLALIEEAGGAIVAEHDVHESFSGDGLIVAAFGEDPALRAPVKVSRNRYSHSLFRNPLFDLEETLAAKGWLEANGARLREAETRLEAEVSRWRDRVEGLQTDLAQARSEALAASIAAARIAAASVDAPVVQTDGRRSSALRSIRDRLATWRRFLKFEGDRFLERQRRSIQKRLKRPNNPPSSEPEIAPAEGMKERQLTEFAETVLWRLDLVRRQAERQRSQGLSANETVP